MTNSPKLNLALFKSSLYKNSSWTLPQKTSSITRNGNYAMLCLRFGQNCIILVFKYSLSIKIILEKQNIILSSTHFPPSVYRFMGRKRCGLVSGEDSDITPKMSINNKYEKVKATFSHSFGSLLLVYTLEFYTIHFMKGHKISVSPS